MVEHPVEVPPSQRLNLGCCTIKIALAGAARVQGVFSRPEASLLPLNEIWWGVSSLPGRIFLFTKLSQRATTLLKLRL